MRHGNFADYLAVKQRLFLNQREGDLAVLNVDNAAVASLVADLATAPLPVSLAPVGAAPLPAGGCLVSDRSPHGR